ncbi:GNAT family N-acetyltransferase [Pseudochryseolinea flava]|uniref:GNAT family N-acetyltransferase n=1 Tax=Pseudochryseolinea flava TaxID=2059302 RepID=A0A364Y2M4_9BACT|nr:GNAT family N-acetyltransferase [Pseudochryseolinea flava]RAW00562.1 GNAT family N-acetyltransferase [Pseudochryseolinea flava]
MEEIEFRVAGNDSDFSEARSLFRAYADSLSFTLSYQNFEAELATLSRQYAHPEGAMILSVYQNQAMGCVGIRRVSEEVAELKRLFVKTEFRKHRVGKQLLEKAIEQAGVLGYRFVRLDTVPGQEKAQQLYRDAGFYTIDAYRFSPIAGTIYMEKKLDVPAI